MSFDVSDDEKMRNSQDAPPLCLQEYFAEREASGRPYGQVVARKGNLIVVEFRGAPPAEDRKRSPRLTTAWYEAGFVLLLIACGLAAAASLLRF